MSKDNNIKTLSGRIVRFVTTRTAETVIALLIVLVFYAAFMLVLEIALPVGGGFSALMTDNRSDRGVYGTEMISGRNLRLVRGTEEADLSSSSGAAAQITYVKRKVKSKSARSVLWRKARVGMPLFDQDAVQTFKGSHAAIEFGEDDRLEMGPNSLIIIKRLERDFLFKEKRTLVVVADGEFRGKFFGSRDKPVFVEVATPYGIARIRTRDDADGPAEFRVAVNPDRSSSFTVFNGTAIVEAKGEEVKLESNQITSVLSDNVPSLPVFLPAPVLLDSPRDSMKYYYRELPPRIEFRWKEQKGSERYRFVLASDPFFEDILVDERVAESSFTIGNLNKGTYFWRVSTISGWSEGSFSETRKIDIVLDRDPPVLRVDYPPKDVQNKKLVLKGETEPGAKVFVKGVPVKTARSGIFNYAMDVQAGINMIVVEAVDEAGNITYSSKMINGKF
ncbi:MAG: FecR domain-containing protein [Nitrospirota bacterium]|nr:MAG: FecR domain-containing protein [Nitrospirota bacterium]